MPERFFKGSLWKEGLLFVIAVLAIYQVAANWNMILNGTRRFFGIVQPFFIGAVFAYFLSNPTRKIQERFLAIKNPFIQKRSRSLAVLTMFIIIVLILIGIISWMVPIVIDNVTDFANQLTDYWNHFNAFLYTLSDPNHEWAELLDVLGLNSLDTAIANIFTDDFITNITTQLLSSTTQVLGHAWNTISTLFSVAISMIICLYVLIFTDSIKALADRTAKAFIKKKRLMAVKSYARKSNEIFINFISAQFLDACILGTLATIILGILNVPYAVTLGVILGIANMIPYFGSIFATLLASLITLITSPYPTQALIVLVALMVLQQIDGNFIGPRITGQAIGLNPIVIIISITVAGAYFGILGMFVSVPIAAMLKMFYFDYLDSRERKRQKYGEPI